MKQLLHLFLLSVFSAFSLPAFPQIPYPGREPGKARASHTGNTFVLENNALQLSWKLTGHNIKPVELTDKGNGSSMKLITQHWFQLVLQNGDTIDDNTFRLEGQPVIKDIHPIPHAAAYAERIGGKLISATLINKQAGLTLHWEGLLTDGANYIRQRWTFQVQDSLSVAGYLLLEIPSRGISQAGTVDGSPLVSQQMFFALEHPMSKNEIGTGRAVSYLPYQSALQPAVPVTITTVMGVTPKGQLRRGFVYYIERERAHPYRPFLHYNSWYDLSWVDRKMEESSCMDRIKIYGDSLIRKRHVPLKAFLFDDGWDNDSTLWQFGKGFPDGFSKMLRLAKSYGAGLGVWISPWGGYDPQQSQRLKYGRMQHPPFETNANGFSLAGPVYYQRFRQVATDFITKYGVSIFKFDGVGAGNGASGAGLAYQKDIESLLKLTRSLRHTDPDIYLSLTVGTWPSPYWLYYADATWRAGGDFGMTGEGNKRQRWITYRDAEVYKNIVQRAPLYPLSSLMIHGICIADNGYPAPLEMDVKDVADEIWSFFGSGTSLQELYINPHKLSSAQWDCLAEAALWSEKNKAIMPDVHWVGGDPASGAIYGHAAWSLRKGVLTLRNPSAEAKNFTIHIRQLLELPEGAATAYILQDEKDPRDASISAKVGQPVTITLQPFEVKVWNVKTLRKERGDL